MNSLSFVKGITTRDTIELVNHLVFLIRKMIAGQPG